MHEEEFDELKFEYKSLVKQEKLTKSIIDATLDVINSRDEAEKTVIQYVENAKLNNDSFEIKRFSRELNDLRDAKEPADKELSKFKEELLDIYDKEDNVLKKLEKTSVDIIQLKYAARFLDEEYWKKYWTPQKSIMNIDSLEKL